MPRAEPPVALPAALPTPEAGPGALSTEEAVQALVSYLEHEPQPAIVLDPGYRILAANTAYRRQFATVDRPHLGQPCYRVSHHYEVPCDQAGEHCPMKRAAELKGPDRVLHIHHTPRGPEHVDVELRPILDARREVVAYVERLAVVRSASARASSEGLVGRSAPFVEALAAVQRVGPSGLPVLLLGESGTGKELFARAVHEASPRARGPFVVVDCSGLTETLFESELFGYEKGAFTGAQGRKKGLVETAAGGTLFLDEMGDVPLAMQVKLLRLIESGTFRRVGGLEALQADFRLVAATHKPLEAMVADGRFRQDLYYRIAAFPIRLPPLRERLADIPLLVDSFLRRGPGALGRLGGLSIEPAALQRLGRHTWPGNLRELRNVLDRARLFADDGVIRGEHLPAGLGEAAGATGGPGAGLGRLTMAEPPELAEPPEVPADAATVGPWFTGQAAPAAAGVPAGAHGPGWLRRTPVRSEAELRALAQAWRGTRRALAEHLGWSERTLYRRLRAAGLAD